MLPSGTLTYSLPITSARYEVDGPAAPWAIGSYSIYTTQIHPNTGNYIQGFSWGERFWATPGTENDVASLPMGLDIATSGIPSGYFQSGIGSGGDLEVESIERVSGSGLSGEGIQQKWSPVINHGYYNDFNERAFLFSDDSEVVYLTHSGVVPESLYLADSGFNQTLLTSTPKVGVPIAAEGFEWDNNEGKYKLAVSLSSKTEFTGIRNVSGVRASTYDEVNDVFLWNNIDRTQQEFIPLLTEDPVRLIFNSQYVVSGVDNPLGLSDGSHNKIYHTQFAPIDNSTALQVFSYTPPSGSPTYWTPVPSSGTLTGYEVGIDYDLGILRFGETNLPAQPVPASGDYIGSRYWRTLRIEWEPEGLGDTVTAIETSTNPVYRRTSQGFVYLSNTVEDPSSIVLSSLSPQISLNNYGPLSLGNIPSAVVASVTDRNGNALEDQIVTFYISSNPPVGSFGASLLEVEGPTGSDGTATAFYLPPRSIDDLGEVVTYSGFTTSGPQTTLQTSTLSIEGLPDDVYLYKVYVDDPLQGYLDTTTSGDAISQLKAFYTKYFQDESIYGTTGLSTAGGITASGDAILWEDTHRMMWDLARPLFYGNGSPGRRQLVVAASATMLNPFTFQPGAIAPVQPISVSDIGGGKHNIVFDSILDSPLASAPSRSGSLYGYFLVAPTNVALQASVWSTRLQQPIYSNKIYLHLTIPSYLNGVWIVDTINRNERDEIAGLLLSHLTASGQRVPLGLRLKSSHVTLAAALDGVTFLDVNSPWEFNGESQQAHPSLQRSDALSPYWTASGVFSVPSGVIVQSGIYLGQSLRVNSIL